ncbi:TlpA disulfide reductase family protein [Niveispirillum sp.]|uniref:TlpA family protein disulfide reductase n=1 Tax=Niveispirillum sp. TaxID=1917217 RepID=UPI001B53A613|nr:TlpA disulfide reductase family protein [Niveispirillum sp.]MBP7339242.1 TlpA family protein disulfide reductase [Niveispirillum sp.]
MSGLRRRHLLGSLALLPLVAAARGEPVITDLTGVAWRMADFRGGPLLLDIWASWCAPCVVALPMLQQMATEFQVDGLRVVALSIDRGGAPAALRAYHRMGITALPLYLGDPDAVTAGFAVKSLPTTLLFDAAGREFARFAGTQAAPADRLRAAILDLLRSAHSQAKD